ncbi:MAG: site-2 protease family protein, partial [Halobacteria archaeon]|nr:site-2 protease family protein [Halobacteria archaeon]
MSLIWILLGFALYWSLVAALDSLGVLKKYGMSAWGPLFLIKTLRGRKLLDKLAKPKRFWRVYGNIGIALALIVMAITFVLLLLTGIMNIISPPEPSQYTEPRNIVAIPGINDFLPLTMTPEIIIGLLIGIVVHEGGHGIMCRVGNINVSSMGLVTLAILPIGAFVEPDEDEVEVANQGERTRMFAAGVMNNFVITAVVFVLLALSMTAVQPVQGVGVQQVLEDTPASEAGLVEGDVIKSINGEQIRGLEEFSEVMSETEPG